MIFLLGFPIFRGYVKLRGGKLWVFNFFEDDMCDIYVGMFPSPSKDAGSSPAGSLRERMFSGKGIWQGAHLVKSYNLISRHQVIQFVTFSSPSWRSLSPLKGSLNHPKEVTLNHQATFVFSNSPSFISPK